MNDIAAPMSGFSQGWIPALLLVLIHSYFRFNTPPTSRSSTTAGRYHVAAILYSIVVLGVWSLLAKYPQIIASLGGVPTRSDSLQSVTAPLYAALAVTALMPNTPVLKDFDEKLRSWLQDFAHIPYEAMRISSQLQSSAINPDTKTREEVAAVLLIQGFSTADISFSEGDDPRSIWGKIATIKFQLDQWKDSKQFVAFVYSLKREFDQLEEKYESLSVQAKRLFEALQAVKENGADGLSRKVADELASDFRAAAKAFKKAMCDIISRGALKSVVREKARNEALRAMGFEVDVFYDQMFDKLMWLFLGFSTYYIVTIVAYRKGLTVLEKSGWQIVESAMIGLLTATTYVAAVASAVYIRRLRIGQPRDQERPVKGYLLAALSAMTISLVGTLFLVLLITGQFKSAWEMLGERSPWSILALVTAFATAFNLDNRERPGIKWFEAVGQALVGMTTMFFVYSLLDQTKCTDCHLPPLVRLLTSSGLTGGVIGLLVPTWYRQIVAKRGGERAAAVTARLEPRTS